MSGTVVRKMLVPGAARNLREQRRTSLRPQRAISTQMSRARRSSRRKPTLLTTRLLPNRRLCSLTVLIPLTLCRLQKTIRNGGQPRRFHACDRIGVEELRNIGPREEAITYAAFGNISWRSGFFEYAHCSRSAGRMAGTISGIRAPRTTVLTVANVHYEEVLNDWIISVRRANVSCHVLALDDITCQHTSQIGCRCLRPESALASTSSSVFQQGWHADRLSAVKNRFAATVELLLDGYDVLLHDADVFFRKDSIAQFMDFVLHLRGASLDQDLIIQDNGVRKDTYDRLNWGFSWIRSNQWNRDVLQCVLDRWDDEAFECNSVGCNSAYSMRSQPRINHIIEASIQALKTAPRVCMLSNAHLQEYGIKHFTGYLNAQSKKTCSKSQGYLISHADTSRTIAYKVPSAASPVEQRYALISALNYASANGRKLHIPWAYWKHGIVDFCLMFEIKDVRIHNILVARETHTICAENHASDDNLQHACLSFDNLVHQTTVAGFSVFNLSSVLVCDPTNKDYAALHQCHTKRVADSFAGL